MTALVQPQERPNNTGLPDQLKSGIESLSGLSMDHVKVHYNSSKPAQLQAHAYTQAGEIHVGPGQEQHLPHEAWHVVQQAQGRVRPTLQMKGGLAVNDDAGLEREADLMGTKINTFNRTKLASSHLTRPGQSLSAAQFAAPGGIRHVTNSCFVAAMINIFTVTPSLKNLLNPDAHPAAPPLRAPLAALRNLLFRATNTVNSNEEVPAPWVKSIMITLANNGFINHAEATADVNETLMRVVQELQQNDASAGQQNGRTAGGLCVWPHGTSIEDAVKTCFSNHTIPNAIVLNRHNDHQAPLAAVAAPRTFQVNIDGQPQNYRLTSIVQRNTADYIDQGGNTAPHFVSYVDRSVQGNEWWQSDDIGPQVVAVQAINGVPGLDGPGAAPRSDKSSGSDALADSASASSTGSSSSSITAGLKTSLASLMATRRQKIYEEESDDESGDESSPVSAQATNEHLQSDSHGSSSTNSMQEGLQGQYQAGFNATTDGVTYVYQIATEDEMATHSSLSVNNAPPDTQQIFIEQILVYAKRQINDLKDDGKKQQARQTLRSMLFFPTVQELVASDNELFDQLYVNIKDPNIDLLRRHRFDPDAKIDQAKRSQRIHSISDQLHYLLIRLGSGEKGLANDSDFIKKTGTEQLSEMTQITAKEAQASTLAKLVSHYLGDEVRLPVYRHRAGPMLGKTELYEANGMEMKKYNAKAAATYQQILSSPDDIGSNIRVTDATAGPGAYISTDGDNYYGPHGFAFDSRDVHQLPLSASSDNQKKHSAERTKEQQQQFRATAKPIPFVKDGASHVAEYFVGTSEGQQTDLPSTLNPTRFNPGILPITAESVLRDQFREHLDINPLRQVHTSALHDQPKSAEEVALVVELLQELEGLYEPLEWALFWQNAEMQNPILGLQKNMASNKFFSNPAIAKGADNDESKDDQKRLD